VQPQNSKTIAKLYDAIIIGGGPAGISCALELTYCEVECLVICRDQRIGGQLWDVGNLFNFAGGYFQNGGLLAQQMDELTRQTKIEIMRGKTVDRIDAEKKLVFCGEQTFAARSILISTGLRLKQVELPNSSNLNQEIIYRDDKDLSGCINLQVAVLGGGDNALMKALDLASVARHVYLINRSNKWRTRSAFLDAARKDKNIEILENTEIKNLSGESRLNGATVVSNLDGVERDVSFEKLFVKVGYSPNTEAFKGQVEMDESGYLIVDRGRQANMPGIFAAGDIIADGCPRVATACGDGAIAAESMQIYLGKRLTSR
jgi:thioredoxin reductase (NADPH)